MPGPPKFAAPGFVEIWGPAGNNFLMSGICVQLSRIEWSGRRFGRAATISMGWGARLRRSAGVRPQIVNQRF